VNGFLDTSVIVRYLVEDQPALTDRAARIIDGSRDLLVTDIVIAEVAWVLTKVYRIPREAVVDDLVSFLQKENIGTWEMDKGEAVQGLLLCRPSGRVSFADAMVWAAARSAGAPLVYSFDERFPSDGVEVRREA
jgi:predicted nucleic acid-binding protein